MTEKGVCSILAIFMVFMLVVCCAATPSDGAVSESDRNSSSTTIYVPDSYSTIQAAEDAASPGDTIIVRDGEYRENIDVTKRLTIKSENGSGNCIVAAEDRDDDVFEVTADYVNISGFSVKGATGWRAAGIYPQRAAGIYLHYADYCSISNNNCSNNDRGISLQNSNNNNISTNTCTNNWKGIFRKGSNGNFISISTELMLAMAFWDGIFLHDSNDNSILNNTCSNNSNGISLKQSKNNCVSSNTCSNNDRGIYLDYSSNNKIMGNNMLGNGIVVGGHFLSDYTYEIDETNMVNGKPVYYWKDVEGGRIPRDAGQVILVNCTNVTIEDQNLNNASIGIQLVFSSYITIKNNNCSNNNDGVRLEYSNKNRVVMNNCSNNYAGFTLDTSNNNSISNNNCSNNGMGIYLVHYSNSNSISNNNCSNNLAGVNLLQSNSNSISNNNCSNNGMGIFLMLSKNNWIENNNCSNALLGIILGSSSTNTLVGNTFIGNGIVIRGGQSLSAYTHEIDETNTVNGKPVYYWKDVEGGIIPDDAGQVILVNCTNVTIEDQNLNNASIGIQLVFSSFSTIKDNNCSNNLDGIRLEYSNNSQIVNNICSNSIEGGIYLYNANNNSISSNNCSDNDGGIHLEYSNNNKLTGNAMIENGIVIRGTLLSHYTHEIDETNTVNGKTVYYWKDRADIKVPDGAGQIIMVNCTNLAIEDQNLNTANIGIQIAFSSYITIKNNTCSNSDDGIRLFNSKNNSISGNTCLNNDNGIYLLYSNNNSISSNTCTNNGYGSIFDAINDRGGTFWFDDSNNGYGIQITHSNNNLVYLNNFINNANNADYFGLAKNAWNSTKEITYTYNEKKHTNFMGNYWDDYNVSDADNDGIGDTSYSMDGGRDNYPLMQPWENYFVEENGTNTKSETSQFAFSSYYQPINISVNLNVPPYQLPLNLSNISNIEDITKLWLNRTEEEILKTNGFVILDYGQEDDIVAPYKDMKERGIPIFVTTDTLLHLYHIQFNEILKGIEEREFFDALVDMSNAMLEQSIQDHENLDDAELKESARRNVAYFAVALKLLQTPTEGYNGTEDLKVINFSIPDYVTEDVNKEIANITQHEGFHPSAIFNSNPNCICDYPCCYCEDYSQYVPRGHYTRSEQLKRYFNAMMWYGRIAFMLKGCNGDEALISGRDANLSTIQAALIASELPDVTVNNSTAQEIWDRIYTVTAFFVGTADDLTPYAYRDAQNIVFGTAYNASDLSDEDKLLELKVELAKLRSPEIYGGSGVCVVYPPITEAKLYVCLNETKGMRFMGQRFVPDSYMFQQLVSPAVGMYTGNGTPFTMCYTGAGRARCFPRGLDIMSVLGSERAEDILEEDGDTEYAGLNLNTSYEKQLNKLKSEFTAFNSSDWNRNLYWSWLYTLKPLLKDFSDGYQTFMNTTAWQEKELQTALASWTELRHDTILYGKQSYTPPLKGMPPEPKPVVGYVEPVPEFYARLLALTEMTEKGLVDLDVLNETEKARLQNLGLILERLMNISKTELENEELTEEDYKFIMDFGANLDSVVTGVNAKGKETTIVADVHTDCNTGMVLEEGVGYVDLILVAYIVPDGRIIVGAGPVLSYYEFTHPMDDRLTDDKWKEMLKEDPPKKPGWVDGICVDG